MVTENFAKYLINISHLFNIILPKPCQIFGKYFSFVQYYFAKTLSNLCLIFAKSLTKILINNFNQYNSGNVGRMIYFRKNSIV